MDERLDKVKVQCDYLPLINFAIQQNGASIIHQLSIENTTPAPLKDIQVQITTEPTFRKRCSDSCGTDSAQWIDMPVVIQSHFVRQLFHTADRTFIRQSENWNYLQSRIRILPNLPYRHSGIRPMGRAQCIARNAGRFHHPQSYSHCADHQESRFHLGTMDWQSVPRRISSRTPDRVRKQMAAIYTAITEQQIIYSTIPASFEEYGQRVRLADSVMAQKLGTCLDMALLYASCLEAIGLNALIIITQGHAFAGAWLVPETSRSTIDDVSLLTKRTAEGI